MNQFLVDVFKNNIQFVSPDVATYLWQYPIDFVVRPPLPEENFMATVKSITIGSHVETPIFGVRLYINEELHEEKTREAALTHPKAMLALASTSLSHETIHIIQHRNGSAFKAHCYYPNNKNQAYFASEFYPEINAVHDIWRRLTTEGIHLVNKKTYYNLWGKTNAEESQLSFFKRYLPKMKESFITYAYENKWYPNLDPDEPYIPAEEIEQHIVRPKEIYISHDVKEDPSETFIWSCDIISHAVKELEDKDIQPEHLVTVNELRRQSYIYDALRQAHDPQESSKLLRDVIDAEIMQMQAVRLAKSQG